VFFLSDSRHARFNVSDLQVMDGSTAANGCCGSKCLCYHWLPTGVIHMRNMQLLAIAAGLPLTVVLADCFGDELEKHAIEQPVAIGPIAAVKVYSYHCQRRDSCEAFCNDGEVLIGGGCAVEQILEGRTTPPSLQNAWIKKQEHTHHIFFDCSFQGAAKVLVAQSVCLASAKPATATGPAPAPAASAPAPGAPGQPLEKK
jgi:hypothetical protein